MSSEPEPNETGCVTSTTLVRATKQSAGVLARLKSPYAFARLVLGVAGGILVSMVICSSSTSLSEVLSSSELPLKLLSAIMPVLAILAVAATLPASVELAATVMTVVASPSSQQSSGGIVTKQPGEWQQRCQHHAARRAAEE